MDILVNDEEYRKRRTNQFTRQMTSILGSLCPRTMVYSIRLYTSVVVHHTSCINTEVRRSTLVVLAIVD